MLLLLAMLGWVSPLWYVLAPPAALWLFAGRYGEFARAARRGLADETALRLLAAALACCAVFVAACGAALFYETALWAVGVGAAALGAAGMLARAARGGVHPGLQGFGLPLPQDGLEMIERHASRRLVRRARARHYARALPLLALLALGASGQPQRWWLWLCLAPAAAAPLLLIPYRRAWVSVYLAGITVAGLGWNAATLKAALPPGKWTAPWAAAQCSNQVIPLGDGTAWCFTRGAQFVNRFDLRWGYLVERQAVEDASVVLHPIAPAAAAIDQALFRDAGLRGPMTDLGQAGDGSLWVLQRQVFNPLQNRGWWLSARGPDGNWRHYDLARLTGMRPTRDQNAMAVDAMGRVWFTAVAPLQQEKYLGILNPDGTLAYPLFLLGKTPFTGPYYYREARPHLHGVVSDGSGGIYLYNGEGEPLRHWRP